MNSEAEFPSSSDSAMARSSRLSFPGCVYLVAQRGVDSTAIFRDPQDLDNMRRILRDLSLARCLALHGYAFLPDRFLLLLSPGPAVADIGQLMQTLGRRYVRMFNLRYQRRGTLWESRFRSAIVEPGKPLLDCLCWLESSPARVNGVETPQTYPGSSLAYHLGLAPDTLISDHMSYWQLGNTPFERQAVYGQLYQTGLPNVTLARIEHALLRGDPIADGAYLAELAQQASRPLVRRPVGRPKKTQADQV